MFSILIHQTIYLHLKTIFFKEYSQSSSGLVGIDLQRLRDSFVILSVNNNKQFCRQFRVIPRKKSSNLEKEIRIGISILVIFKSHEDIFQQLTKLSR